VYKHLLIASDGSDIAMHAVDQGLELAKLCGAKVTAITVTEPWISEAPMEMAVIFPAADYEKAVAENASNLLKLISGKAQAAGVDCTFSHVKDQFAAEGIVEAARTHGCDLIVMASHGRRGLSRLILGSQAHRVLSLTEIPVLICR
jgi:nucleotide-binding universal stress UspA family protein